MIKITKNKSIEFLEKELKTYWENTKEERERTHTNALYKKFLKKEI